MNNHQYTTGLRMGETEFPNKEFMELCNISNPTSDGEEAQEARDQVSAPYLTLAVLAALIGFHVVNVLLLGYQLTGS
jgi:hypothetical protein